MKRILTTLSLILFFNSVPGTAMAFLGIGDTCANCSTEAGEILRQAETIAQMVAEMERLDQQIKMMEQNLKQLPASLKSEPISAMSKLAQLTLQAKTLKADQNLMIQIFNELYPEQSEFADLAGASDEEIEWVNAQYRNHYEVWSKKVDEGLMGTFQVSARQLKEMTDNGHLQSYISNLLNVPDGSQAALEAANQLAALQLNDSTAMRELMASMAQSQALRDAKAEKLDQATHEAWQAATKTDGLKNRERNAKRW